MRIIEELKSFFDTLEQFNLLFEEVKSPDDMVPNMAGKSVYYSKSSMAGKPLPLEQFKGEFSVKYKDAEGKERVYRGKNNIIPFGEPTTPVNGYNYYLCSLLSDDSVIFSIKAPRSWTAPRHGAGVSMADTQNNLLLKKLEDFSRWQFGKGDGYIIRRISQAEAIDNNIEWLETPLPDGSGYVFAKDFSGLENKKLPGHHKIIGTIENRGRYFPDQEVIRTPERHRNKVLSVSRSSQATDNSVVGEIPKTQFFVMKDGTKVYRDGTKILPDGSIVKPEDKPEVNVGGPKSYKDKFIQMARAKKFTSLANVFRTMAVELTSLTSGPSGRQRNLIDRNAATEVSGFNSGDRDALTSAMQNLQAKYQNITNELYKNARRNYLNKHGEEGLQELMSPEGAARLDRFVANKFANYLVDNNLIV